MDLPGVPQCGRCQQSRLGASIYGAIQQPILAARAFGLGTSLTMLYAGHEDELRGLLGLPDDALTKDGCCWAIAHKAAGRSPNEARGRSRALEPARNRPPPQLTIRCGHCGARRGPRGWTLGGRRRA